LQFACHPVAVVILHVHKYEVTRKFNSGGLHEKHVVTTGKLGNHLSIRLQTQGNQEKPMSRWPIHNTQQKSSFFLRNLPASGW